MFDFLPFTFPYGYGYFNEFAEPIVWLPVAFAYALLISGTDLLILASLGILTGRLKNAIPTFLVLGLSFFAVVLLGPLAEIEQPSRASSIMTNPHVVSSSIYPGISLMALYGGILWPITFILALILTVLYFTYPVYKKGGFFSFLSFGVKTKESYLRLQNVMKVLAIILLPFASLWAIYPGIMFLSQTWLFAWRNWNLIPPMFFAETFVTATASVLLLQYFAKIKDETRQPLLLIHAGGAIALAGLISLQIFIWGLWFENPNLNAVIPLMIAAGIIFLVTFLLSLASTRMESLTPLVGVIALIGVVINKWNLVINGQLVSRTGMAVLEPHLPPNWLIETISPIAAAVLLLVILSFIYPLEVREHGA